MTSRKGFAENAANKKNLFRIVYARRNNITRALRTLGMPKAKAAKWKVDVEAEMTRCRRA